MEKIWKNFIHILISIAALCVLLQGYFSWYNLPIIDGDGPWFLSVIYCLNVTGMLKDVIHPYHPGVLHNFDWYGWSSIYVVSIVSLHKSDLVYFAIWLITFINTVWIFFLASKTYRGNTIWPFLIAIMCYQIHDSIRGRPEIVGISITLLIFTSWLFFRNWHVKNVITAVLLGLLIVTAPSLALLSFFCWLLYLSIYIEYPKYLFYSLSTGILIVISFFIIMFWGYPYTTNEWLSEMYHVGKMRVLLREEAGSFLQYYVLHPSFLGMGFWIIFLFLLLFFNYKNVLRNKISILLIAILILLFYRLGFYIPDTNYNIKAIFPICMVAFGFIIAKLIGRQQKIINTALYVLFFLSFFSLLFNTMRNYASFEQGVSYEEAKRRITNIISSHPQKTIQISLSYINTIADRYFLDKAWQQNIDFDVSFSNDLKKTAFNKKPGIIIQRQSNTGNTYPQIKKSCNLLENKFLPNGISFCSFQISNTPKAYNYAILKCVD